MIHSPSDRQNGVGALADLHLHSTASDGLLSPVDVVRRAAAVGIERIALTDHDVTSGLDECIAEGERLGIDVIPGIELTVRLENRVGHLLGYGFDRDNAGITELLDKAEHAMSEHVDAILDLLRTEGLTVDRRELSRLHSRYPTGTSVVLHLTRNRLLPKLSNPWRVLRMAAAQPVTVAIEGGIQALHDAGGIAVLAHPGKPTRSRPPLSALVIESLAEIGLDGLEVWHHAHDAEAHSRYLQLADRLQLLATGGSDSHGRDGGLSLGTVTVGGERLAEIDQALTTART